MPNTFTIDSELGEQPEAKIEALGAAGIPVLREGGRLLIDELHLDRARDIIRNFDATPVVLARVLGDLAVERQRRVGEALPGDHAMLALRGVAVLAKPEDRRNDQDRALLATIDSTLAATLAVLEAEARIADRLANLSYAQLQRIDVTRRPEWPAAPKR